MRPLAFALTAALATGSCAKSEEIGCKQVASSYIERVRAELARDNDTARTKTARVNLPTLQNAMVTACEEQKWPQSARRCLIEAKSAESAVACDPRQAAAIGDEQSPESDEDGPAR